MKIFKDIFCGDELLCDNDRPLTLVDGVVYCVKGKYIEVGGEDFGLKANVEEDAAEGATADGTGDSKQRVVDVVHQNRLQETSFDKKAYLAYMKGYMKKLKEAIEEKDKDRATAFMAGAQTFVKKVMGEFDDYQFFLGENGSDEGMVVLCKWEDTEANFFFWADGLKGEKV